MEDLEKGIRRLQSELCRYYYWIEPGYFFDAASKASRHTEWISRHIDAMKMRADDPELIYKVILQEELSEQRTCQFIDYLQTYKPWMHLPYDPWNGFVVDDSNNLLKRPVTYFMACSVEDILFKPDFVSQNAIPRNLNFGKYFSNTPEEVASMLSSSLVGQTKRMATERKHSVSGLLQRFWKSSSL